MDLNNNQDTSAGSARGVAAFIGLGLIVLLLMLVLGILPRMRQQSSLSADAQELRAAAAVLTTTPHHGDRAEPGTSGRYTGHRRDHSLCSNVRIRVAPACRYWFAC